MQLKTKSASARKGITLKVPLPKQGIKQITVVPTAQIDVLETVKHYLVHDKLQIRHKRHRSKAGMNVFFLIDSSGSMVKDKQIAYIKGLVAQTIARYRTRRIKYAAVALTDGDAQLLSTPTLHADGLLNAVAQLPSGGKTNMKAGFSLISQLLKTNIQEQTSLYIFTDGKINAGHTEDPFNEAVVFYKQHLKNIKTTVINNEYGFVKLGLAEKLAIAINAGYQLIQQNTSSPSIDPVRGRMFVARGDNPG
ncbi:VWA domain-containing protein [Chitinophaga sp. S165]|uniref:vWA domain-containing protein n=1 Tax=Chitinophaga sp. S165 TaxID=2135462 RepID=UPI000D719BE8|nr:VWA domain-containing protein [Chitinophaga sp. S165]PWV56187.1 Mg-chelatase subunit ChlD [Chitinophaga sp. S165]